MFDRVIDVMVLTERTAVVCLMLSVTFGLLFFGYLVYLLRFVSEKKGIVPNSYIVIIIIFLTVCVVTALLSKDSFKGASRIKEVASRFRKIQLKDINSVNLYRVRNLDYIEDIWSNKAEFITSITDQDSIAVFVSALESSEIEKQSRARISNVYIFEIKTSTDTVYVHARIDNKNSLAVLVPFVQECFENESLSFASGVVYKILHEHDVAVVSGKSSSSKGLVLQ